MRLIFIPGLGYDQRIFRNLKLPNFKVQYLNWIEPLAKESISDYAQRLYNPIKTSSDKTILIGHSLGGIVAQEIACKNNIDKIILISSIKSRKELPLYFKIVAPLRLHKFFTNELCLKTVKYWGKGHGFDTDERKDLFKSMVGNQSNTYLQWALKALSTWQTPSIPALTDIFHIHGTNDKTLPYRLVEHPDFTIVNGSHICVLKRSEVIAELIKKIVH